ncbi:hypothetical protein Tco_1316884 [Tanacetum coccineum]
MITSDLIKLRAELVASEVSFEEHGLQYLLTYESFPTSWIETGVVEDESWAESEAAGKCRRRLIAPDCVGGGGVLKEATAWGGFGRGLAYFSSSFLLSLIIHQSPQSSITMD